MKNDDKSDINLLQNIKLEKKNLSEANFEETICQKEKGLSELEVAAQKVKGLDNRPIDFTKKKIRHIIIKNLFSYFNILNIIVATCLFYVGSYINTLFLGIAFLNTIIGIVQEIRAKKALEQLSLSNMQNELVIRDGKVKIVTSKDLVQNDMLILRTGNQVSADCTIKYGQVEVNEAMLTGESDSVVKLAGDTLLSGSFVTSDVCCAKVVNVGKENYINKITKDAKKYKKHTSEIMDAVNLLVKWLSFVVFPLSISLFWHQYNINFDMVSATERTATAVISMLPQGMVLLINIVLAMDAIKLAQKKILVQEIYGLENFSKIDVVCMDKTGTLTQNKLKVNAVKPYKSKWDTTEINNILASLVYKLDDSSNNTFCALREYVQMFNIKPLEAKVTSMVKFSSTRKWSGIEINEKESFILGAPEIILKDRYSEFKIDIETNIAEGNRVVLLAFCPQKLEEINFPMIPVALIILNDLIRDNVENVINLLQQRNVQIKIVSGDNPLTVSKIAKKVGLEGYENYIDASTLKDKSELKKAAKKYAIFGRVSPNQKRSLICIFKELKQKVAMVGDGVNDVLALKEADCSVALQSGNTATKQVSQIVLMKDDLGLITDIIFEGQRTINNIQRAGIMFFSKIFFTILLIVVLLFWKKTYPLKPIHFTLINALTISLPAFVFSFEKDYSNLKGRFLNNIMINSLPSALTMVLSIVLINISAKIVNITETGISTLSAFSIALVNLLLLRHISQLFDNFKKKLWTLIAIAFPICAICFQSILGFEYNIKLFAIFGIISIFVYWVFGCLYKISNFFQKRCINVM